MTNQMLSKAQSINILSDYLGIRGLPSLTQDSLQAQYGFKQADLCILYGGSIIAGGDVLAEAIKNQVAEYFIISGGNGHTTHFLRSEMKHVLPGANLDNPSEAEMFPLYLQRKYRLKADFLETESTNCGNNVTNVLALAKNTSYRQTRSLSSRMPPCKKGCRPFFSKKARTRKLSITPAIKATLKFSMISWSLPTTLLECGR